MSTYYDVLGVTPQAEDIVIEGAYKALLKRHHPDVAKGDPSIAQERAKQINEAYQVLKNPNERARYDRTLGQKRRQGPSSEAPKSPPPPRSPATWNTGEKTVPQTTPAATVTSNLFIVLALLVIIGALSSFLKNGERSTSKDETAVQNQGPRPTPSARKRRARLATSRETPPPALTPTTRENVSPSFDCAQARGEAVQLICEDAALAQADQALAVLYRDTLAVTPEPQALLDSQRRWLRHRDGLGADAALIRNAYAERSAELSEHRAVATSY